MTEIATSHEPAVERFDATPASLRQDPEPHPWRNVRLQEALIAVLASAVGGANPNPDDDHEPSGPGAPYIRQELAALAVIELGTLIADPAARGTIQTAAREVLVAPVHETLRADPEPSPWRNVRLREAVVAVVASAVNGVANPNPDDDREPSGPGAPHVRQALVAVAVSEAGSLIADAGARATIQKAATAVLAAAAR